MVFLDDYRAYREWHVVHKRDFMVFLDDHRANCEWHVEQGCAFLWTFCFSTFMSLSSMKGTLNANRKHGRKKHPVGVHMYKDTYRDMCARIEEDPVW